LSSANWALMVAGPAGSWQARVETIAARKAVLQNTRIRTPCSRYVQPMRWARSRPANILRTVAGGVLLALAVVSCSSANAGDKTTLRIWAMGREGEVLSELMPGFEKAHPDIHVEVQQIPWTAAHEKLLTAYVGEATPDIAMLGNTWVPEFVALNALAPLDTLTAQSKEIRRDDFFDGIWKTNVVNGKTYGIPWYVDTRLIFYRSDLLAKAGYKEFPKTWAEWVTAMKKIKSQMSERQYPMLMPTNEWPQPVIFALEEGSPILRDGGRYGAFEQPEFRKAFDFY